jgi:hypothetical protein
MRWMNFGINKSLRKICGSIPSHETRHHLHEAAENGKYGTMHIEYGGDTPKLKFLIKD